MAGLSTRGLLLSVRLGTLLTPLPRVAALVAVLLQSPHIVVLGTFLVVLQLSLSLLLGSIATHLTHSYPIPFHQCIGI